MRVAWTTVRGEEGYVCYPPPESGRISYESYTFYGSHSYCTFPQRAFGTPEEAIYTAVEQMPIGAPFSVGGRAAYFTVEGIMVRVPPPYTVLKSLRPKGLGRAGKDWAEIKSIKGIENPTRMDFLRAAEQAAFLMDQPVEMSHEVVMAYVKAFRKPVWLTNWKNQQRGVVTGLAFPAPKKEYCEWAVRYENLEIGNEGLDVVRDVNDVVLTDKHGEEYHLGNFQITLTIRTRGEWLVSCDPTGENSPSRTGYYHPHVSDTRMCTGEAGPIITRGIATGYIQVAMDAIEAAIRTYNHRSPYCALETWNGVKCAKCGDRGGDVWECRNCGDRCCAECLEQCRNCGRRFCGTCHRTFHCSACNNVCCNNCGFECRCCNDRICASCVQRPNLEDD